MSGSVEAVAPIAVALPETEQRHHFDVPDFRVRGKFFCTARTAEPVAMVKIDPELQAVVVNLHPDAITPAAGAWGRSGSTLVRIDRVPQVLLADLIAHAWRRAAPKALAAAHPAGGAPGPRREG